MPTCVGSLPATALNVKVMPVWPSAVKKEWPLLPLPSTAVQVTRVRPTRKTLPDFGRQATRTEPSIASTALTE